MPSKTAVTRKIGEPITVDAGNGVTFVCSATWGKDAKLRSASAATAFVDGRRRQSWTARECVAFGSVQAKVIAALDKLDKAAKIGAYNVTAPTSDATDLSKLAESLTPAQRQELANLISE